MRAGTSAAHAVASFPRKSIERVLAENTFRPLVHRMAVGTAGVAAAMIASGVGTVLTFDWLVDPARSWVPTLLCVATGLCARQPAGLPGTRALCGAGSHGCAR